MTIVSIITLVLAAVSVVLLLLLVLRKPTGGASDASAGALGQMLRVSSQTQADSLRESRVAQSEMLTAMDRNLQNNITQMNEQLSQIDKRLYAFTDATKQDLENIRTTVHKNLTDLQADNNKKLDEMRGIVDEKLQKTLNDRITQSFRIVTEQLEQVSKGLGEMQGLAQGVGDLKKVLTNVKTRGIMGEIQLGSILEQILAPSQYDVNVETKPGSGKRVEYAIKIPVDGDFVYLPVDSKFPGDTYANLCDAYDSGDKAQIDACVKTLLTTIKLEAKDIYDKYLDYPQHTTEFALLFLPFEGLYAEVVNRGMVEVLQRDYHVNIVGPSTMAAMLNSLQMSFQSIAILKRSDEVWNVLGAVKTEFSKFEGALSGTQKRLEQASRELEALVGTRTRAIIRKLKNVTELPEAQSETLLSEETADDTTNDLP